MSESSPTTAIYIRSDIAPRLEEQRVRCQELAERLRLHVVAQFQDPETPVFAAKRAGYQAMLKAAHSGDFLNLIVDEIKYLWRMPADCDQQPADLVGRHVQLIAVSGEDTRRDGWVFTMQKYITAERDRKAKLQSSMDQVARQVDAIKKKRP